MSRKGRRIRTAEENKKKEFRKMIELLIYAALILCLLVVEVSHQFPEYTQLECFHGQYHSMERRKSGRRGHNAFGLVMKNGSSFYIHKDFDWDTFTANVSPGEELTILAETDHRFLIHYTREPVVYELTTSTGEKIRSYEDTLMHLQQQRRMKATIYGVIALMLIGVAGMCFRDWSKYRRMIQEHGERKKV